MADRPERDNRRGGRKSRKKVCAFCVDKIEVIDYKDISRLRRFISERAKILPRRVTGTCVISVSLQYLLSVQDIWHSFPTQVTDNIKDRCNGIGLC